MEQKIKEIIIPIDYSVTADNALVYAKSLAKHIGASIRLLHVYAPSAVEMNEISYVVNELELVHRNRFAKYIHEVETQWKDEINETFSFTSEFRLGFAGDEIISISENKPNIMIVMGSKGEGASKNIFGSVSTRVAQKAKCPVLIIPPGASFSPIKSIAYCSNDESLDAAVMHKIINLAQAFEADINLVHVGWTDNYSGINLLDAWRQHYPKAKISLERLDSTDNAEQLNEYCRVNEIDVLALGTRERGFFSDLFHKSFTKEMAIHTKIPLLITHSVKTEIQV